MAYSNQKLISLINSFSKTELEQFRIFISTPFFTKGRNYITYLDYILDVKENSDTQEIPDKKKVKGKGDTLSEQTLRNRCSELYKLGEEFLIYTGLCESNTIRQSLLLKKLNEKKLNKSFFSNYYKAKANIDHEKFDISKLRNLTSLSEILAENYAKRNKIENFYNEFYDTSKYTLCLNLLILFQIGLEFNQQESDNRIFEPNYVIAFLKKLDLDNIILEFRKSELTVYKVTAMNYYLFKAYGNDNVGKFYAEAHSIFTELRNDLKDSYKIIIFKILINHCIIKLNTGDLNYRYKLFDLYNEKLDQDLTSDLESNTYTFNHFRDYVFIGISIKKYKWVENFIKKYSGVLPPELRDSETKFSYAKLDFEKKNFRKSLDNLNELKSTHYLQYIDTSLLKLCNYFELKKYEEAFLEIDKHKHYLKNHKEIPLIQHKYTVNFMKVYLRLVKYFTEPEKKDPGLIESEFKKYKHIAKKGWMREKILEITK